MTPEKQKQKLQGQTSIAQKIFQFVPIDEAWTPAQIGQSMTRATSSRVDPQTLKGVLMTMTEAGLIRIGASGQFQRTAVSMPTPQPQKQEKEITVMTAPVITSKPAASAIDLLSSIAQKLRSVAVEIDNAALAIEEGQVQNAQEAEKLKQLKALFKELS